VVVAVIDSGIDYTHEDLAANMFRNDPDCNANGLDNDGNGFVDDCFGIAPINGNSDPIDDNDHGSHVAGIIGAVGNNGIGMPGSTGTSGSCRARCSTPTASGPSPPRSPAWTTWP
jgi:subtilisin family serine protease